MIVVGATCCLLLFGAGARDRRVRQRAHVEAAHAGPLDPTLRIFSRRLFRRFYWTPGRSRSPGPYEAVEISSLWQSGGHLRDTNLAVLSCLTKEENQQRKKKACQASLRKSRHFRISF